MKFHYFFLGIAFIIAEVSFAQNVKHIAAYDNNSSTTSGLYAIGDTALYRYSWYFQEWFPLHNNGLNKINDTVSISVLAVYNNESSNSSGLFVFSDTAVYNYNWITTVWYPLSNNGLPRINQKPDVKGLTVYGPAGSSSNSTLFALSDTAIFRYSWFYQAWTPLSNTGLITSFFIDNPTFDIDATAYPNPFSEKLNVSINLPKNTSGKIELAVFNMQSQMVYSEKYTVEKGTPSLINLSLKELPAGMYFCEISDGKNFKQLKIIKSE